MGIFGDESLFDSRNNSHLNSNLSKHRKDLKALELIKRGLEAKLAKVNRHIDNKKQAIQTTVSEAKEFKRMMMQVDNETPKEK